MLRFFTFLLLYARDNTGLSSVKQFPIEKLPNKDNISQNLLESDATKPDSGRYVNRKTC